MPLYLLINPVYPTKQWAVEADTHEQAARKLVDRLHAGDLLHDCCRYAQSLQTVIDKKGPTDDNQIVVFVRNQQFQEEEKRILFAGTCKPFFVNRTVAAAIFERRAEGVYDQT